MRIGDDDEESDDDVKEWEKDPLYEKCMKISEGLQNLLDQKAVSADQKF